MSIFPSDVDMTRNCIARRRSEVLSASLLKASVAFLLASLNRLFASESARVDGPLSFC